jgi:hypothetical protein
MAGGTCIVRNTHRTHVHEPPFTVAQRLDKSPTHAEFLSTHLANKWPVLFGKDLTESWPVFHLWKTANDEIDWDYLVNAYGTQTVPVTDCRAPSTDVCTESTTLSEVIKGWQSAGYDATNKDQPLLCVKDWHLARWVSKNPATQPFYSTPHLFADDWLNHHYCTFTDDDFRFIDLGIKGTSTPFHKDVHGSYSWSTNVVGRKLWTFWFPWDESRRRFGKELVQEAGETVFVYVASLPSTPAKANDGICSQSPSGWFHTVENLTTCISIKHNWCHSLNLYSMYDGICRRVLDVEQELRDVRELLSSNAENQEWEVEWMNTVQDAIAKDAGWK